MNLLEIKTQHDPRATDLKPIAPQPNLEGSARKGDLILIT